MMEAIDFNDFDKVSNGFEDEARLWPVHRSYIVVRPEVLGACEDRRNGFEDFCDTICADEIRPAVINLAFEIAMDLGLINKFGTWQTRGEALAESKEQTNPIWMLVSAWVVDTINASSISMKETAEKFPEVYREFYFAMLDRKIVLAVPPPAIPDKKSKKAA